MSKHTNIAKNAGENKYKATHSGRRNKHLLMVKGLYTHLLSTTGVSQVRQRKSAMPAWPTSKAIFPSSQHTLTIFESPSNAERKGAERRPFGRVSRGEKREGGKLKQGSDRVLKTLWELVYYSQLEALLWVGKQTRINLVLSFKSGRHKDHSSCRASLVVVVFCSLACEPHPPPW